MDGLIKYDLYMSFWGYESNSRVTKYSKSKDFTEMNDFMFYIYIKSKWSYNI